MNSQNEQEYVDVAQQVLKCISSCSFEALRALLDTEATMELPYAPKGVPLLTEGADNIVAAVAYVEEHFSKFVLAPHAVYCCAERETVILEATSIGVHKASGTYQNRYIFVFTFKGKKILCWREYLNPQRI